MFLGMVTLSLLEAPVPKALDLRECDWTLWEGGPSILEGCDRAPGDSDIWRNCDSTIGVGGSIWEGR